MPDQNALTTTDFESLVQIASELTSEIDLSELLHLILTKSGELSDSPDGAILLHDENRNTLYFAGAIGQNASMLLETFGEFAKQQVPVEGSKAGSVFQSGESIIISEWRNCQQIPWGWYPCFISQRRACSTCGHLCI